MRALDNALRSVVERFAETARSYCAWVEGPVHDLRTARLLLLELLLHIDSLVDLDCSDLEDPELPERGGYEEYERVFHLLADFPIQCYWTILEPSDAEDDEPVLGDVHDDLADIYMDLCKGLQALDHGYESDAVFDWVLLYQSHWGAHAAGALHVIDDYYCRNR